MRNGISILLAVITAALSVTLALAVPGDGQAAGAAVNVVDFGAVSGGSATANAAAFQAAHDALPTTGGIIVIPGGDFNVNGATIQVTKPVTWQGQGHGSRVISDSFTLTLFNVATTKGVTFRDFFIDSSVTKTAGAGIVAQGDGTKGLCGALTGGLGLYGITVRSMLIRNQYVGIDLEDACNTYIVNNIVTESYNYALRVTTVNNASASSNMINGNTFASQRPGGKAALIGSGIDAVNNTFYGTGSPVVEFNTVAVGNDVARLVGNHIEGSAGVAVALKVNPTGYMSRLIISGNTIDAETTAILLTRAGSNSADGVVVNGNHLWVVGGTGSSCLDATYATNLTVTGNFCGSFSTGTSMTGFFFRDGVNNARVDGNNFRFNTSSGTTCINVGTNSVNVALSDQNCVGFGTIFVGGAGSTRLDGLWPFAFATLPAIGVGSRVYCTDCDPPSNPCASTFSRTGAFAVRTQHAAPIWACGY